MIRCSANISLSWTRVGANTVFISLGPIEEESGRPSKRSRLIFSRGIPRLCLLVCVVRFVRTHTRITSICDVRPAGLYVEIREKQSVPFTGNVYMDRLRIPLTVSRAFGAPGISRMRLDARARIYPALLDMLVDILVRPRARFVSSPVYRIPRIFDTRASLPVAPAPLNRKAAY